MITIVYKRPNEKAKTMEIENTLEKLQELVEGYIEIIPTSKDRSSNILMIVNEDGLSKRLEQNIRIGNTSIVGNIIFAQNGNDGEFHSLTDAMIKEIIRSLE